MSEANQSPRPFQPRDFDWQPEALTPEYRSTRLRAPKHQRIGFENTLGEMTGPVFGHDTIGELDNDLTVNFAESGQSAVGERILVFGQLVDQDRRPVSGALMEFWQANAGGRYRHSNDGYLAPLDPNFGGCGRTLTAKDGSYSFMTVRPGPYPWPNGGNNWRPAHIHFSLFGGGFAQRLITQMYFEGDPLIHKCAIVNTIKDPAAIGQLISRLDMDRSKPMDYLAYRFDIVLRGHGSTVFENRPEGN